MATARSLHAKLLAAFGVTALLTAALGGLAYWQFARIAADTARGLDASIRVSQIHQASEALAARRAFLLLRLQASTTATAVAALVDSPEWRALLADSNQPTALRQTLARHAANRHTYLLRHEELGRRLDRARDHERELRGRLLPAVQQLAADQVAQQKKVNGEVEGARNDTTAALFVNFDATMNKVGLLYDAQAGLFELQAAEAAGTPAPTLRAALAAKFAQQDDPVIRELTTELRAPVTSPPAESHQRLLQQFKKIAEAITFDGRTTVVTKAIDSLNTMAERIDASQTSSRLLSERSAALDNGLQKSSNHTAEILQLVSRLYGEPSPAGYQTLAGQRAQHLARAEESRTQLTGFTAGLKLDWVGESLRALEQLLFSENVGLWQGARDLVAARTALDTGETALLASLAAETTAAETATARFIAESRAQVTTSSRASLTTRRWIAGITVFTVVVALALAIVFARNISRILQTIAQDLGLSSNRVAEAATAISQASHSLAEGANTQAAALEQASAALEEINATTKGNAESADRAQHFARETRLAADQSIHSVTQLTTTMADLQTASTEVAKIVKSINEIAFQTNILALNAAVEAARAGEAGAGFSVVAEEVRALAGRSADAARDSSTRIAAALARSHDGARLTAEVATSLSGIVQRVRQLDTFVATIAQTSGEQATGIMQLSTGVQQIDRITQANAATAQESAAAAAELDTQIDTLEKVATQLVIVVAGTAPPSTARPFSASATALRTACAPKIFRLAVAAPKIPATITEPRKNTFVG